MPLATNESVFSMPLNHFRCAGVASLGCIEESAEQQNLSVGLNRFVGDQPNALLKALDRSIKSSENQEPTIWSTGSAWPLVLFGPSGTGKTSLGLTFLTNLDGLANSSIDCQPAYITATDFNRRFRSAMETDSVVEFRASLAGRSGLLIDNLHELATKPTAQLEIVRLIDAMISKNRPILFTMADSPHVSNQLIPQLTSRLGSGLALPVSTPGSGARFEIIRDLAEFHQLKFSNEAIHLLVDYLPITVPGINQFMIQFKLAGCLEHAVDEQTVKIEDVQRWFSPDETSGEQIEQLIRKAVAKTFNVKVADLSSPSRKQTTVTARGVAIYLNRIFAKTSFKRIGQQFGNRDHSTIMHAYRKIKLIVDAKVSDLINNDDRALQKTILNLKQTITQQITAHIQAYGKPVS